MEVKYKITTEELKKRAKNGDVLAITALEYRDMGALALINDLRKK